MKRPATWRDVRPQLDEAGLGQLAKQMLEQKDDALRIRKSKLGVKQLGFLSEFRHIHFLALEEIASGIEAVKHLDQLRQLSLMRIRNLNLSF